jgi:acyl-CoA thioesterase-1
MMRMRSKIAAFLLGSLTASCGPGAPPADGAARADGIVDTVPVPESAAEPAGIVLFLGTSLTAGYGVGADVAYPAIIQQKIDSAGLPFRVVNGGISGETSGGGLARLDWMLQQPLDVLVLELGANDGLRGYDIDTMRDNLETIIRRTRETYPDVGLLIAGMEAPPNLGPTYTRRFRETFRELALAYDAALVPFLLEGVAAETAMNIEDGIHPNAVGHERVAATVWSVLGPLLERRSSAALVPAS